MTASMLRDDARRAPAPTAPRERSKGSPTPPGSTAGPRRWLLPAVGLALFHICFTFAGQEDDLWLPGLGVGIALFAGLGARVLPWLALDLMLLALWRGDRPWPLALLDGGLLAVEVAVSWWLYRSVLRGARWLGDPGSAAVFLTFVPGVLAALFALVQATLWVALRADAPALAPLLGALWLSRALGILAVLPALLVVGAPLLGGRTDGAEEGGWAVEPSRDWTLGEALEVVGLCAGNVSLTLLLAWWQLDGRVSGWMFSGLCLLIVVWAGIRQGLRGACLCAGLAALAVLVAADVWGMTPSLFSPLQGNLLAQASVALLVGASAGWLRASEARYRHVVGHLPVVLYSARLPRPVPCGAQAAGAALVEAAAVVLVSPAARQVLGSEPDALLGPYAGWLRRVAAEDRELLVAALTQLGRGGAALSCEYRVASDDEPERWVRETLAPALTASGELEGWEGVLEDVTERRALAQEARRSASMLQALVANLPTGVYFVQGGAGQPLLVNARARQLLGRREDLAAGVEHLAAVYRLHRPDGTPYPADELPIARALRRGSACSADDIVVHRPDGRRIPLITWAAPVDLGGGGRPDAAVWVLEDLTPLRQAETARRESERRLEAEMRNAQRLELVARLAGGTVHDFNNLLTVMIALAGLTRTNLPADHPSQDDLSRMIDAGEQAAHLAGQLLTFGKQRPRAARPVDLAAVVRQTQRLLRGVIPTPIRLETELPEGSASVSGDETQLKQVLMNLCLNARDAMPRGGRLTLRVEAADEVRLSVADTGHGMSAAVRTRVFEPFYSTKERGTGLGLAVVRQIVTEMGGTVALDSSPDAGTRVEVRLPRLEGSTAHAAG